MKTSKLSTIVAVLLVGFTFMSPFCALARQNSVILEAKATAERDARSDVNKGLWLGAGCLVSGSTVLFFRLLDWEPMLLHTGATCLVNAAAIAEVHIYQPAPPASRLLGKSPEYVNFYTDAYKAKAGSLQAKWATVGYLSGGLAVLGILLLEAEYRD